MSLGCRYRSVVPSWIARFGSSWAPVLKIITMPWARREAMAACSGVASSLGSGGGGRGGGVGQVQGAVVVRERVVGVHVWFSRDWWRVSSIVGVSVIDVLRGGWFRYCGMAMVDGRTLFRKR